MAKIVDWIAVVVLIILGIIFLNLSGSLFVKGGGLIVYLEFVIAVLVGVFCIAVVGYVGGLGRPHPERPPENKEFSIKYIKVKGDMIYLLLVPLPQQSELKPVYCKEAGVSLMAFPLPSPQQIEPEPIYYKVQKKRFKDLQDLKEGSVIKNLHGTIEIVSTPS